ncbi:hypothetical protein NFI96_001671 [Prochilodus magdalenae]|nr:hypothetical protein NFI96_001671 [Prochilodus magdalenae]
MTRLNRFNYNKPPQIVCTGAQEEAEETACSPGFQVKQYQVEYDGGFLKDQPLLQDESRFTLSTCDRVWRRRGERSAACNIVQHDLFGSGSVMVWGGISLEGRTALHVLARGSLTAIKDPQTPCETICWCAGTDVLVTVFISLCVTYDTKNKHSDTNSGKVVFDDCAENEGVYFEVSHPDFLIDEALNLVPRRDVVNTGTVIFIHGLNEHADDMARVDILGTPPRSPQTLREIVGLGDIVPNRMKRSLLVPPMFVPENQRAPFPRSIGKVTV